MRDFHRDHHHDRHWHPFEAGGRRGFGGGFGGAGWGGGFGNWGNFGDNIRVGRMLASGDLRLVALYLIEQQPRHGYDLIKAIEEKTAGFYSPSPGIVYPALTFLEEAGFVTSSAEGNKKLYTITEEGRAHLNENRQAVQTTLDFLGAAGERMKQWREKAAEHDGGWWNDRPRDDDRRDRPGRRDREDRDIPGVIEEVNVARRDLKAAISDTLDEGDEESQRRLADILRKAAELIRRRNVDL
ncbi:MAG TPA: PadR family transcriptional regulator [Devosiaceae bacterium]|nr:PadR family transcriptional regulator [Devosiaceae bacterium]